MWGGGEGWCGGTCRGVEGVEGCELCPVNLMQGS